MLNNFTDIFLLSFILSWVSGLCSLWFLVIKAMSDVAFLCDMDLKLDQSLVGQWVSGVDTKWGQFWEREGYLQFWWLTCPLVHYGASTRVGGWDKVTGNG